MMVMMMMVIMMMTMMMMVMMMIMMMIPLPLLLLLLTSISPIPCFSQAVLSPGGRAAYSAAHGESGMQLQLADQMGQ